MATGVDGATAPDQIYTSYDVAVAAVVQPSVTLLLMPWLAPLEGPVLVTQDGTGIDAVVNVVLLETSQPVAAPLAFLGTMYQLYNVPAISVVAL